jgi:asparagine synthase (glutamine-hydrolysing)
MCGVTGYWAYSSRDLAETMFGAFSHSLAHRGPDGFGIEHFPEARLWLGHRRLAIVDLSERAHQPMSYADGRYWLTYDGEVYNYVELREELRNLGHRFISDSDGEVILSAYAQWGQDCQLRFNGMWAFAIWDTREQRLFLSRDRFGVKPLHYTDHNGAFVFASELKAFLSLPWIDGTFDPDVLVDTLTHIGDQEDSPYTLLPGVLRLPAGHAMLVEADGRVQINTWWNTLNHLPQPRAKLDDQAEEFRALFFDACRLRLRSEVPLATALSGGLDSSAIACTLAALGRRGTVERAPKDWQRAFVACFIGTPYDERQHTKAVIDHTGMTPHYQDVDGHLALQNIEKVIFAHETVYWFPTVAGWTLSGAMRRAGVRVCFNGQGSDELLGNDPDYISAELEQSMERLDWRRYVELRHVMRGLVGGNLEIDRATILSELRRFAKYGLKRLRLLDPIRRYVQSMRGRLLRISGGDDRALLRPPLLAPGRPRLVSAADPRARGKSPLESVLFEHFHRGALPMRLTSVDRTAMANGIETRMPFLDWRLVTFGFALSDECRNSGGYTKRVLRESMQGLMPDSVRLRTSKIGYIAPIDYWARGALKPWLSDLCANRSFLENPIWNGPRARAQVERSVAGKTSIDSVWPILNAYVLEQSFKLRSHAFRRRLITTY